MPSANVPQRCAARPAPRGRRGRALLLAVGVLAGCQEWGRRQPPPEPPPPPRVREMAQTVIGGTIGSQSVLADVQPLALRGFGVVIGLDGRGGGDCPTVIREYLLDYLGKQIAPQGAGRRPRLSPADLLESTDTAVVEVLGSIPAGARRGTRFDVEVRALAGTATRSLAGGLLLPTELRYYDRAASGQGLIAGRALAEAGGPVFVNPFAEDDDPTSSGDPRRGTVLGGARSIEARPVRLLLLRPDFQLARAVERRLNERFGPRPKVAEAASAGYIVLDTPPEYARRPERFRQLAAHLFIDNSPAHLESKRRELADLAAAGGALLEPIALAWEGMGRSVVPHIQPFYAHGDAAVRFYAARTGARLGDPPAVAALADIAATPGDPHRLLAVRELGETGSPQAAVRLVPLLADSDQEVRIAAYEALVQHRHPAVRSRQFRHILDRAQLNCILDVVECDGPPLVYVRRTRLPRIAVLGRSVPVIAPVFYTDPDGAVTIVTHDGSDDLHLFARATGRLSDEIIVPPLLDELIAALAERPARDDAGRLMGLGLPLSRVVHVIARLSEDGAVPARLVLEQPSLTELLGPEPAPERPETDAAPSDRPAGEPAPPPEPDRAESEAPP